jgi:ATP-dependent Clp protease protease subunit
MEDRIIMVTGEVNDTMAEIVTAQLLYLASEDPKKDIQMYINSPGGSISAGLAIYDTMNYVSCDVSTICMGTAASMGAFLLSGGAKGKRFALPNAEVLIHQPLIGGGVGGQATDIKIITDHLLRTKEKLTNLLAEHTGQTFDKIAQDTERDNWMTAEQAKEYGLIDHIISNKPMLPPVIF